MKPIPLSRAASCFALPLTLALSLAGCPGEESATAPADPATTDSETSGGSADGALQSLLGEASGTVTHNEWTFEVFAALAVWDEDGPDVQVAFLSYVPTDEEIDLILQDQTFIASLKRKGEGVEGFDDRAPYLSLGWSWLGQEEAVGDMEEAAGNFAVSFLAEPKDSNSHASFSSSPIHPSEQEVSVEGDVTAGGALTLRSVGNETGASGDSVAWDVTFSGAVATGK